MKTGSNSPSIKAQRRKQHQQKTISPSTFHLGIIFEKDSNGNYTGGARLYHDIISYALADKKDGEVFLFNDIAKFVIKRNAEYQKYYSGSKAHMPMSARIANRRDTIEKCIKDLQKIELVEQVGTVPALKNKIPTPKYAFTSSGKTVALLLQRLVPEKRQDAEEQIFQLIKSNYSQSDAASNRFHVRFLERLKIDGLLGEILDRVTIYLSSTHELEHILNVFGFVGFVTMRAFSDPEMIRRVLNSYVATFKDIDAKTRRIILRYEKNRLENNIASGSFLRTKEWEELWIDNVADDSKIVLGGVCKECRKPSAILMDYFEHLKGILTSEKGVCTTTCPKCKAEKTFLVIPGNDSRELRRLHTL